MSLTVRDVLDIPPINQGKVIAGLGGIDQEIKSVSVLEVVNKGYISERFMEPNIFAISSLNAIAEDIDSQLSLINLLHTYQISALALFNVGLVIPEVSPRLIQLCNDLDFPLIQMPIHISYYDTIYAVLDRLFAYQVYKLENSAKIYETFMNQQISAEGDISQILDSLSDIIHSRVALFNFHQKCLYSSWPAGESPPKEVLDRLDQYSVDPSKALAFSHEGVSYLFQPVVNTNIHYGVLVLENITYPLSDLTAMAIAQACRVLCITLLSNERKEEYQLRKRRAYLMDLISGNFGHDKMLIDSQGRSLGYDISQVDCVMVVSLDQDAGASGKDLFRAIAPKIRQPLSALDSVISLDLPEQMEVIVLIPERKPSIVSYLGRQIASLLEAEGAAASIGVGPACGGAENISFSYEKARQAIRIAGRLFPQSSRPYVQYDDVEIFAMIQESINREQAARVTKDLFCGIDWYDEGNNSQLSDTFYELLINNLSTSQVAQRMYLHKNTVLQRKNKISGFYDEDPFEGWNHLKYELGFVLKKLFNL